MSIFIQDHYVLSFIVIAIRFFPKIFMNYSYVDSQMTHKYILNQFNQNDI